MKKLQIMALLASAAYAQHNPTATMTVNYTPANDVGFRSQARLDVGDYVFTHLFNKEVGQPMSSGYGKVFSFRRKGFVEAGFTTFKLSDHFVYGAEIGKSYKWGRLKGYSAGMFPVTGDPFMLTDNELTLPAGFKVRGFANAPLPAFRATELELKKRIGCKAGLCYSLSVQDDYFVKKNDHVVKAGLLISR